MNAADICHEISDCPGLYVDAFRGRFLRRTQDPDSAFILTHYHGDHYQNLQREGKYKGPALIHCTPVTAALLVQVHQVPSTFVVEHEYGQTFEYCIRGKGKQRAKVTFYDANHCPGACIVLIQLPNGTTHLHTGDMRYHERFKSYPLLREAVANQQLDLVYLDTTYSHPKHDFVPQEEAVEAIASQTAELLSDKLSSTLVLLSCYSIGKEKVLWEACTRSNQLVYVTERKWRMLQCIQGHESQDVSSQIIHRCTQDANQTDIHVIPMGLAGEMWPFFRPNYQKCAEYVEELDKDYDKVVAFLPTGWANASKWNKEHSISQKQVERCSNGKPLQVEVRLVSYSEHSAFSELVAFVQYLRPRKVIPTVFSDDADHRKIEGRFRNLLDSTRAKKAFFRTMEQSTGKDATRIETTERKLEGGTRIESETKESVVKAFHWKDPIIETEAADSDIQFVGVRPPPLSTAPVSKAEVNASEEDIRTLVAMGFDKEKALTCLKAHKGKVDMAIDVLLSSGHDADAVHDDSAFYTESEPLRNKGQKKKSPEFLSTKVSPNKKQRPSTSSSRITNFFSKKQP
jgi:DNA cross-link repair 1A protein